MGVFDRLIDNALEKRIQALDGVEGNKDEVALESLLTGNRVNTSIPGTTNAYKEYRSQVRETYRKYNGRSDFGNAQVRAIVDLRTAMIAGEGISISTQDENLANWIEGILDKNKFLNGSLLLRSIKGTEMCGKGLFKLDIKEMPNGPEVVIHRVMYKDKAPFFPIYRNKLYDSEVLRIDIEESKDGKPEKKTLFTKDFVYVCIGGDDVDAYGPTTKVGVVLTDIENYDRAIKDMRRNNHITARVTPTFETKDDKSANSLAKKLADTNWKIGKAFAGSAKLEYKAPPTGAHDNLKTELSSTIKNISATTGVPVHWMGFVDMMSNRSTADSLYEMIKHSTSSERIVWEEAVYALLLKAQEMYIDAGGTDIKLNPDFQVRLPLLDFSDFKERVAALSMAYADEAISIDDYRNAIPGIDPLKTAKAIEEVKESEVNDLINSVNNPPPFSNQSNSKESEDGESDKG